MPQCVSPPNITAPEQLDSPCLLGDAGDSWGPCILELQVTSAREANRVPQAAVHAPALPPSLRRLGQLRELAPHSFQDGLAGAMGLNPSLPAGSWQGPPGAQRRTWPRTPANPILKHGGHRASEEEGASQAARDKPGLHSASHRVWPLGGWEGVALRASSQTQLWIRISNPEYLKIYHSDKRWSPQFKNGQEA